MERLGGDPAASGEPKTTGKTTGKKLSKTAVAIVDRMRQDPEITIPELAERLGRSVSAIEKQIRQLKDEKLINRVGSAKGGHWTILE
ncbi:hypothetical protein GCM10023155_05840 [Bremerella cremea]|uniref:winged helix-turn-helix transcriptional regulator n=1 Tax=Bremerella cremea TaxID=1031537 RepID=UPI0033813480